LEVPAASEDPDRFALRSGERQVAQDLAGVRRDHRLRYELMVRVCRKRLRRRPAFGADIFCGTGYGTALLAESLECPVLGIDGSSEAIHYAERHYGGRGVLFVSKLFPFDLPEDVFDFVCLLESIEHVDDAKSLFRQAARALRPGGILLVSTPNSDVLDLARNPNPFHVRHYSPSELSALAESSSVKLEVASRHHQNVYEINAAGLAVTALPEDQQSIKGGPHGQFMLFVLRRSTPRWFRR
jgi:2-polyprenyl-3-methyl-5-hydroxy-6-metoxy-1,4-benzoquinol methylase